MHNCEQVLPVRMYIVYACLYVCLFVCLPEKQQILLYDFLHESTRKAWKHVAGQDPQTDKTVPLLQPAPPTKSKPTQTTWLNSSASHKIFWWILWCPDSHMEHFQPFCKLKQQTLILTTWQWTEISASHKLGTEPEPSIDDAPSSTRTTKRVQARARLQCWNKATGHKPQQSHWMHRCF